MYEIWITIPWKEEKEKKNKKFDINCGAGINIKLNTSTNDFIEVERKAEKKIKYYDLIASNMDYRSDNDEKWLKTSTQQQE